jgi:hypothetical protein
MLVRLSPFFLPPKNSHHLTPMWHRYSSTKHCVLLTSHKHRNQIMCGRGN